LDESALSAPYSDDPNLTASARANQKQKKKIQKKMKDVDGIQDLTEGLGASEEVGNLRADM